MTEGDIISYYKLMFEMKNADIKLSFSIDELESMYPYERQLWVDMINSYMKEKQKAN